MSKLKIGDQVISDEEFYPLLAQYQLLPQLAKEIILDQAIKDIECNEEEITVARQQFCQQAQITSEEQLLSWGEQRGMSLEQVQNLILRPLKLEKFKEQTWEHKLDSYFLKRKGQLDKVIYSLIRTTDPGIAQEIYFRVQEGEDSFADLAKQYSQGSEAQTGGLIGPVELSTPHPILAKMLTTSQTGQLLPPTRVGEWIIIIRLEKYISTQLDQPMKQRLINELFQQWLNEELKNNVSFG